MIPTPLHFRFLVRVFSISIAFAVLILAAIVVSVVTKFEGTRPDFPIDCAIVFGSAVGKSNSPGPGIMRRVSTAADLYRTGNLRKLILSGGKGSDWQESEAEVMSKFAMMSGVAPEDIILENMSSSTYENIKFSMSLIKPLCAKRSFESIGTKCAVNECTSIAGISDRYHLARISFLARKQGIEDIITIPAETKPPLLNEIINVVRESMGILYYGFYY